MDAFFKKFPYKVLLKQAPKTIQFAHTEQV